MSYREWSRAARRGRAGIADEDERERQRQDGGEPLLGEQRDAECHGYLGGEENRR